MTINNMIGGGINNSSAVRATQEQMRELQGRFRENELDSREYREQMESLREQYQDARMASLATGVEAANNASQLFNYMNNGSPQGGNSSLWGGGMFDQSVFFESGGQLSELQAMNSARIGIENRARSLVGEIARDRAMGRDVSDRQEALSNLTGNLNILNRNLSNNIDRALSENGGGRDANTADVLGRIRDTIASRAPEGSLVPNEVPATPPENATPPANTEPAPAPAPPAEDSAQTVDATETATPSFAAEPVFEGSVSEQVVAASQEQEYDDMSIASQIANNAQSEYAESIDIMREEAAEDIAQVEQAEQAPETSVEAGVTPANV
jgi:hypothetical protein